MCLCVTLTCCLSQWLLAEKDVRETAATESTRSGVSEMQDGPGINVSVGFESWFSFVDFVPPWKLLVHGLATDRPGGGFPADRS